MKKKLYKPPRWLALALAAVLTAALAGCGAHTVRAGAKAPAEIIFYNDSRSRPRLVQRLEAGHGEDYVIDWQDPGMETLVRRMLDRPEGEIRHSDVWEIRYLNLNVSYGLDFVSDTSGFAVEPKDGKAFDLFQDSPSHKVLNGELSDPKDYPLIHSFADLAHFDALQILGCTVSGAGDPLTDLSGLEHCKNLSVLQIGDGAAPQSLQPLAACDQMTILDLRECGTLDLAPLASMPGLEELSLQDTGVLSLEPVRGLPIWMLELQVAPYNDSLRDGLDYAPIATLRDLDYLDVSNNPGFDVSVCTGLQKLEGLQLNGTPYEYLEVAEALPQVKYLSM